MSDPADLEIRLRRSDAARYTLDLVYSQPDSAAAVHPLGQQVALVTIDAEGLRARALDPDAYGRALGQMLLGEPGVAAAFAQARAVAQRAGLPLRLRVAIAADAPELHALRWETLRDPRDDLALALSQQVILTRMVGSADWQPVALRARGDLRALLVVAAPAGLERFQLAPIDAAAELGQARAGLGEIPSTALAEPGEASLAQIALRLRDGYDILYLVAHGALVDGEPWLFLDDGQGGVARVAGRDLAARLADLQARPRLAVLSICQGAGDGVAAALLALGPRLALAGLPAVVAMQGDLSFATNARFAPELFRALAEDGRIDRAVAAARQSVAGQPDWWAPALFTRLNSGRIWYDPGFDEQDFAKWPTLVSSIARGRCTPILGPGLLDGMLGSTRDLARRLAEQHHFPLAPFSRDDLPQVAQYLAVHMDVDFMRAELAAAFRATLAAQGGAAEGGEIDDLLAAAGARRREADAEEPHRALAGLPFPIYLTANPDRLLADALAAAGKAPQLLICPWNRHGERSQAPIEPPAPARPLVYHLFGRLDDPESLVLTEDDYFRYLIGVTRNRDLLPQVVGSALTNAALLFLGFHLEDWNFRVLFQSVMNLEGYELRRRYTHVAVQIDPQDGAMLNPRAAREYLKTYFGPTTAMTYQTNISIYWGSAEDFIRELARQYAQHQGRP